MSLEQKIEEIKNIKGSCGKFPIPRFTTESMIEEFHKYYHYIKECISKTNDTLDIVKWLVNQGLSEEVANRLIIMIEEGVISDSIFKNPLFIKSINDKITEFKNDGTFNDLIEQQLNSTYQLIDEKMNEITGTVNSVINEVDMRILELQNFETQLEQIENKNTEQDTRLKQVEYKNKVQDVYLSGLFNENNDKRLSIEGEGNSLKLEGSKEGLVEVDKIVGNTLVNICPIKNISFNKTIESDYTFRDINIPLAKRNSTYTYIVNIKSNPNTVKDKICLLFINNGKVGSTQMYYTSEIGLVSGVLTINDEEFINGIAFRIASTGGGSIGTYDFDNIILLEGDYTNKPIPSEYFEGMQSSFEECKVTQEMVDSGEELEENLGKYKCNVKVVGKNLYSQEFIDALCNLNNWVGIGSYRYNFKAYEILGLKPNTKYRCTIPTLNVPAQFYPIITVCSSSTDISSGSIIPSGPYRNDTDSDLTISSRNVITDTNNTTDSIRAYVNAWDENNMIKLRKVLENNLQLEEGTQATPYEPYYERTQTVYLNSPLLKGDEIVCKEDGLYHYHKMWAMNLKEATVNGTIWNYDGIVRGEHAFWCNTLTYDKGKSYITLSQDTMCDKNSSVFQGNAINIRFKDGVLSSNDDAGMKAWVEANNPIVAYEIKEPYYEKISDDKLLLEIPNSATLSIESVIPCTSISATYTGGIPSLYGMEYDITTLQDTSVDIIATAWDTDFRVCEIEWTLEELTGAQQINLLSERGINRMALSRFEQAKIIILGDAYYRPTFEKQLATYLKRDYLTQEEYDILIAMMDAR